jgi:hypothetical protein
LRTECAEVIHQVQLQRKTEQQVMLSSEGFRKSALNSSSNVYIQDSIKFDQIYSDIDTRQLTGLRLWQHTIVNLVCISQSQLRSATKGLSKMRITKDFEEDRETAAWDRYVCWCKFLHKVFLHIDMKIDPSFSWLKLKINRGILWFKMHLSTMLLKLIPWLSLASDFLRWSSHLSMNWSRFWIKANVIV